MKILQLKRKEGFDYKDFVARSAEEKDYKTLIKESVIGMEGDEIKFIYQKLPYDTKDIVKALKNIRYDENKRSNGLITRSRIFGFKPRITMRSDFCSSTSLSTESPAEHAIICDYAKKIEKMYFETHPDGYKIHKELADSKVKDAYRIGGSVFTSGIVNKNNPLRYHFDAGNFKKVYSCMLVFKKDIRGGYLAMPEYDIGVELTDNSIFMFDGQSIMHGVTPIAYEGNNAHRFSVVYYSLQQIWQCLDVTEELARIRQRKTVREKERHEMTPEKRASLEKLRKGFEKRNENRFKKVTKKKNETKNTNRNTK